MLRLYYRFVLRRNDEQIFANDSKSRIIMNAKSRRARRTEIVQQQRGKAETTYRIACLQRNTESPDSPDFSFEVAPEPRSGQACNFRKRPRLLKEMRGAWDDRQLARGRHLRGPQIERFFLRR